MRLQVCLLLAAICCSTSGAATDEPFSGKSVRKVTYLKAIEVDAATGKRSLIPGEVEVGLVYAQRPDGLCDVERSELLSLEFIETPQGRVQLPVVTRSSAVAPCK